MTKKKIERLSVMHRREITWLKWYFLRDKKSPERTQLESKINEAFLANDIEKATFLVNLKSVTEDFLKISEQDILKTVKEVYIYENINVIGACQRILYLSQTTAYLRLNNWFDSYFYSTYKHLLLNK